MLCKQMIQNFAEAKLSQVAIKIGGFFCYEIQNDKKKRYQAAKY